LPPASLLRRRSKALIGRGIVLRVHAPESTSCTASASSTTAIVAIVIAASATWTGSTGG
jgi:hypothetical protein